MKSSARSTGAGSALFEHHTTSLVFNDPPLHTRVRRLIAGALTPKHIAAMEDGLVVLVDGLLDAMEAKAGAGRTGGSDRSCFPPRSRSRSSATCSAYRMPNVGRCATGRSRSSGRWSRHSATKMHARGNAAVRDMLVYLEALVARRAQAPGDPQTDVLTRLIQGEVIAADGATEKLLEGSRVGERLLAGELLHNCIFLLNAGHETTTNLIGNGLKSLRDAPDQKQLLLRQPELIKTAVEEFLRIESSNELGNRITTIATEIGGVALAPRTQVTLCIGAANRDPGAVRRP